MLSPVLQRSKDPWSKINESEGHWKRGHGVFWQPECPQEPDLFSSGEAQSLKQEWHIPGVCPSDL